ncbi:MAG: RNA methyltransferase [Candidatus Omnitrophica bacterium]|nr:RNA methyltransferase [Candidatus Omnitrophota bacterium]
MIEKSSKKQLERVRRLLRDKSLRDAEGAFVVEGLKIVKDVDRKALALDLVLFSQGSLREESNKDLLLNFKKKGVCVRSVYDNIFKKISTLRTPQGVLAVVKKNRNKLTVSSKKDALTLVCDGIQNPGNLGTIIRSASAFGVNSIVLIGETADIYNPKVVRASSGAVLDIPIFYRDVGIFDAFKRKGYKTIVTSSCAKHLTKSGRMDSGPFLIIVGNEGNGVSEEVKRKADVFFHIPIGKKVESLNVTAAAAVVLYEFKSRIIER